MTDKTTPDLPDLGVHRIVPGKIESAQFRAPWPQRLCWVTSPVTMVLVLILLAVTIL